MAGLRPAPGAAQASPGSVRRAFEPWNDPAAKPLVEFRNVTKRFGDATAVDDVSLAHLRARVLRAARPVRLRQDHADADAGRVRDARRGRDPARRQSTSPAVPPHRRPVNMMFQSYALFPHMSVGENIAFGLKQEGCRKAEIARARRRDAGAGPARRARQSAGRTSSPAASASASRWPARSPSGRSCCCSTSRWRRSTASCARRRSSS